MNSTPTIDTARLPTLLIQLRLPTVGRLWRAIAETADRESWPAAKTLAALMEHEIAERSYAERVQADILSGIQSGVNGTPTFFINEVRYEGDWNFELLLAALKSALKAARNACAHSEVCR